MLRQILTLSFVLAALMLLNAQPSEYTAVDRYAFYTPNSACQNLYTLAHYLNGSERFTDRDKARAIYSWITHNIRYNHNIIEQNLLGTRENTLMQQPENVLQNRSAVCEGYANLFKSLANIIGLSAEIVTGKVRREDGQIPEIGHAWIALRLENNWYLSDPTWGAGYYDPETEIHYPPNNDQYFLVPATSMIRDHYPFDPMWQLNRFPMTQAQWEEWDLIAPAPQSNSTLTFFFADTIAHMNRLDTLQRTLNSCARILNFNPNDDYALTQLGLKMYEQGLVAMVEIYESLFTLENNLNQQMDTAHYLRQLQSIEQFFTNAWRYLSSVKNERLLLVQQQVPPLQFMQAELLFVRGHVHYTLLSRYSREDMLNLSHSNTIYLLRRIQFERDQATNFYQQALALYNQEASPEILKKRSEIVFFLARCHYLSAISHLNGSASRNKLGEEALSANLSNINLGKNDLVAMKQSCEDTIGMIAQAEGITEMRKDFPLLMANFLATESLTLYDLVSVRYHLLFDNPLPFLDGNLVKALEGYREGERKAIEGLSLLNSSSDNPARQGVLQFLNAGIGLANLQIGAYQAQVAYKLHEKLLKKPTINSKEKTEALYRIRQAKEAFVKAKPYLEQSGETTKQMLVELQSRSAELAALKKWWDER